MRIEAFEVNPPGCCWTVIIDGRFASHLTVDEALGAIASALFVGKSRPLFLRSYEEWFACERASAYDPPRENAPMLAGPCGGGGDR